MFKRLLAAAAAGLAAGPTGDQPRIRRGPTGGWRYSGPPDAPPSWAETVTVAARAKAHGEYSKVSRKHRRALERALRRRRRSQIVAKAKTVLARATRHAA